jgi:hypothetical protein
MAKRLVKYGPFAGAPIAVEKSFLRHESISRRWGEKAYKVGLKIAKLEQEKSNLMSKAQAEADKCNQLLATWRK